MYKALLFVTLYLPFQIALNPAVGVDLASIRVFILILFFVWLAEGLKNKKINIRRDWQTACIVSFLAMNILSAFFSQEINWSARKLLFLFSIFPLYFVASDVLSDAEKIKKAVKLLVSSGAVVALIGTFQFCLQFIWGLDRTYAFWAEKIIPPFLGRSFSQAVLENPSWLVNISGKTYLRATATFPDPHMLSFYLGLLIPLALAIFLEGGKNKSWWLGSVALMLIADFLTFSRGGYLGIIAGIGVAIVFLWNRLGNKHKVAGLAIALLLASAILFPSPFSARLYSSFNWQEGSNMGRLATWRQAGKVVAQNPVFGVGIGNYPLEIKATADYREPIYAHNAYLDIAAESGLPNALIWLGVILFGIRGFFKKNQENILFPMAGVSLIVFASHSLVETAIFSPVVLTLLVLILSFSGPQKNNLIKNA